MTCRLVACHGEDFCQDHFPAYEHLMRRPPVFRVRIYEDADFRDQNPFGHFCLNIVMSFLVIFWMKVILSKTLSYEGAGDV
jgi:hypothetical protein